MKFLQMSKFGNPTEVVEVVESNPPPPPAANEATVAVEYSAIGLAELLMIRGMYGIRPQPPAPLGNEAIGRVVAVGASVKNVKTGDRVAIPIGLPVWRQALTVAAADLIVLSEQADPQQLSMLRINPLTAALLLTEYVELGKDDWVIQNGGNSGVGRSVIAFAQEFGLRSVSLVRRPELVDELKSAGADVVLVDGPDVVKQVAAATGKAKIKLGIDGVGGDASHSVASCLTSNAKMVAYGGVSGKPAAMSPLNIIFKQVTLEGFWLGYPRFRDAHEKLAAHTRTAERLIAEGKLHVPVAGVYSLEQATQAMAHAQKGGKVLLKPN
jgi:mitochondrial enoyl-[acyl-carrier protein] reductase / trans-2-enoyl-CoA reductase